MELSQQSIVASQNIHSILKIAIFDSNLIFSWFYNVKVMKIIDERNKKICNKVKLLQYIFLI